MKQALVRHENIEIPVTISDWNELHGITMYIMTLNEEKEIKECLDHHKPYVDYIVMVDGGSKDRTVEIASPIVDDLFVRKFDGHYSNQVNRCIERCKTDWALFVDTDERFGEEFLKNIRNLINQEVYDCYKIPRKNYIDGQYSADNYPDYQVRLHRTYCRRIRPVHSEVVGYKKCGEVACTDGNFIIHAKTSARHNLRNTLYGIYEMKYLNEMGAPGTQNREAFYARYPMMKADHFGVK